MAIHCAKGRMSVSLLIDKEENPRNYSSLCRYKEALVCVVCIECES